MLKVCWINNDNRNELKVYEMLALQYFYKQDINSCKKFLDRSLRGKLESTSSSSRKAVVLQGFRSEDTPKKMRKPVCVGAKITRSATNKVCDSVVENYSEIR